MSTKPVFELDVTPGAPSSLEAHYALALSSGSVTEAAKKQMRAPLGVYNISVSRVCGKVERLSRHLESLFREQDPFAHSEELAGLMETVIDYMELAVYAAAEHVDDVIAIASAYFPNENLRSRSSHFKAFDKAIKQQKRFIASLANSIKHEHSRLRLSTVEFWHDRKLVHFFGYFVEGATDGELGPSGRFHAEQEFFSITALGWEILGFLLGVSRALAEFINQVGKVQEGPPSGCMCDYLSKAVVAAARLPLYSFGEGHLFERVTISLRWRDEPIVSLASGLYGAFEDRWSLSNDHSFGRITCNYQGDGSSRTFRLPRPNKIRIQHWT